MKPDISRWRDGQSYDYFDGLSVEGLAWECLRRNEAYQELYSTLVSADADPAPLPREAELRWGVRFRGPPSLIGSRTGCPVVAARRSLHRPSRASARRSRSNIHASVRRVRRGSR